MPPNSRRLADQNVKHPSGPAIVVRLIKLVTFVPPVFLGSARPYFNDSFSMDLRSPSGLERLRHHLNGSGCPVRARIRVSFFLPDVLGAASADTHCARHSRPCCAAVPMC